ncbi:MAG: hypothetical protein MAG431_00942 [Chloroflexi bacterium]|nr:hypothetical protein [Chloroflexota bacterium]
MSEKFWIQDFETGLDRLRVHFRVKLGQVQEIIVIQYEAYIDGQWHAIIRFDEAHGFFHRDILFPNGQQEKITELANDKGLALTQAIEDIKQSWRSYRKAYEDKYYEKKEN